MQTADTQRTTPLHAPPFVRFLSRQWRLFPYKSTNGMPPTRCPCGELVQGGTPQSGTVSLWCRLHRAPLRESRVWEPGLWDGFAASDIAADNLGPPDDTRHMPDALRAFGASLIENAYREITPRVNQHVTDAIQWFTGASALISCEEACAMAGVSFQCVQRWGLERAKRCHQEVV